MMMAASPVLGSESVGICQTPRRITVATPQGTLLIPATSASRTFWFVRAADNTTRSRLTERKAWRERQQTTVVRGRREGPVGWVVCVLRLGANRWACGFRGGSRGSEPCQPGNQSWASRPGGTAEWSTGVPECAQHRQSSLSLNCDRKAQPLLLSWVSRMKASSLSEAFLVTGSQVLRGPSSTTISL